MTGNDPSHGHLGELPWNRAGRPPASESPGPVLYEARSRLPWLNWMLPPAIFGVVEGVGIASSQDPVQSLGVAAVGALFHIGGTLVENSYRWRVTSSHLVYGRLRWPVLRGGGSVPFDRITLVETKAARPRRLLKRAISIGGDDVGRVHWWMRAVVLVHAEMETGTEQRRPYRVVVGMRTAAEAEELAGVLRAASGATAPPPQLRQQPQ